ncbi:nitrite/sulfite reductase [Phycisphaerales bacterium AB-hyl4]|uniref:Nitrite/sulfite reductase n=1 Tax=Natronomicrosphaera hydrolytica TaxID=3242702 RepID=A0ABV4U765_9BACT
MATVKRVNKVEELKKAKDGYDVLKDLIAHSEAGDYDAISEDDVANRFKWWGVYRQKPNVGHFMLRIKIPGGQLNPAELNAIAELTDKYARGFGDITTRQTIQLHWLTTEDLKPIFEKLWAIGMTSQFACGDVPRNIVGCPLAGVLEDEIIDSAQHAVDIQNAFVEGKTEFSNLPRKFKPSIGGCKLHCHQPQINDFGFYGVKRENGEVGYGLLVGGGLSSTPHYGQPLRVFVKPEQVVEVAKAVCALFRDHGYREKRTRARLKFLVADQGWQWTRDKVEEILGYKLEHDDSLQHPPAVHSDHMGIGKQKDGNYYVGVPIERGRWTAKNMTDIARLAEQYGEGEKRIRLTSKQNVIFLDIPEANVEKLTKELDNVGLPPVAHSLRDSLVSCTGSEFCNLAVVETKHRAGRVLKWLEENTEIDVPIMISFTGCPNACSQYQIADIGLTGIPVVIKGEKDENGKPLKVDGYNVLLGATLGETPQFGEVIAKKVEGDKIHLALKALVDAYMADRVDEDETFKMWTARNEPEYLAKLITEPVESAEAVALTA